MGGNPKLPRVKQTWQFCALAIGSFTVPEVKLPRVNGLGSFTLGSLGEMDLSKRDLAVLCYQKLLLAVLLYQK